MKAEALLSHPPPPASSQRGRAVGVVSLLTVIVAGLGFFREAALAAHFGLSTTMDAYFGAIFIPNTVYVILVVGTLSPILISMLLQEDAGGNLDKLSETFSVTTNFALLMVALVVFSAMLTARMWLARLFPGFSEPTAAMTVHLIYIIFPSILFLALAGILTAALNGFHKFALATFAPALSSLSVIATTLWARGRWAIYLVGVATAVGFVLQMVVLIPSTASLGIRYRLILSFRHPAVRRLLRLGWPLLLYLVVANSALFLERNLASRLPVGAVATLAYAMRLFTVPSNFLAAPLAIVAYPQFAREAIRESYGNLQNQMSRTFRLVLCVFLPVTLWTLIAALPLTRILYERGQFQLQDSILTSRVLQFYGIGILPNAVAVILLRCFYALQDTLTPLWAEVADLVFYVSLAPLLTHHFGIRGLAVSRGMSFFLVAAVLTVVLWRRKVLRIDREFLYFFSKIVVASTAMVIVCWLTLHLLQTAFDGGAAILRLAILIVVLTTSAVTFLTVARLVRLREAREITSAALELVPRGRSRWREVPAWWRPVSSFLRPSGRREKGQGTKPMELNQGSRWVSSTRSGDIELGQEPFLISSGKSEKGSTSESRAKLPSLMRFSLPAVFCVLAILTLGFALQINAVQKSKALLAVTLSIACTGFATICRRVALVVPALRQKPLLLSFLVVIGVFNLMAMVAFRAHQDPIDVIEFEVDSVHALLVGSNPYGAGVTHQDLCYGHEELCHGAQFYGPGVSTEGRVHVGFPYPPLALFWTIPGYLLHNVRYAWLLAINLAAVLIFRISPDLNGWLAAVLLLFGAPTINVLSHGYTEPLLLLTLAALVFVAEKNQRLLPLTLGLFLASKQYSLLALPLAALLLPRFSWKKYLSMIGIAVGVALLLALPFLLSDPRGFWWSLVTFQTLAPFRPDALSFSAVLVEHGLRPIPQWSIALVTILATALALWKAPRTPSAFALSLALLSLLFFVLNKQAFANYYFFCFGTLCVGLASAAQEMNCDFTFVRYQHD